MEDVIETPTSELLTTEQVVLQPDAAIQPKTSENLIQNHKRLSILAQIYNWQPTPVSLRLTLPVETRWNLPLIMFEVTPFWIPLNYFMATEYNYSNRRVLAYLNAKPWHFPLDSHAASLLAANNEIRNVPTGVNVIEKDNMPDLSWLAMCHAGWSGRLDFMYRIVSNVTTQGKIAFSRMFNVERPPVYFDANQLRTPFKTAFSSSSSRKKNSFMILDLSRTTDLQVQCPYMDIVPFRRTADRIGAGNRAGRTLNASYIVLDIVDVLDASAGSNEFLVDIWIKAGPDFQFHYPLPPRYNDLALATNTADNQTTPRPFIDNYFSYAPLKFGRTNNVSFLTENTATLPSDVPAPT
jgi:hypothetical protein